MKQNSLPHHRTQSNHCKTRKGKSHLQWCSRRHVVCNHTLVSVSGFCGVFENWDLRFGNICKIPSCVVHKPLTPGVNPLGPGTTPPPSGRSTRGQRPINQRTTFQPPPPRKQNECVWGRFGGSKTEKTDVSQSHENAVFLVKFCKEIILLEGIRGHFGGGVVV